MVTEQCNFQCRHCMVNSSREYSCICDEILEKYYCMLKIGKPDTVYLLGGEPFLHIDTVKRIVEKTKLYCNDILVFSNGSFLLNQKLSIQIRQLDVSVRISDDKFHRVSWTPELEKLIIESRYFIAQKSEADSMIPVGRAYEEFKHLKYNLGCSLLTGEYNECYENNHRYMIMLNGDVNLYCATIEGALANVFEDKNITYDLLVDREKILHNYLMSEVLNCINDTFMAKMCNRCSRYKVTNQYILYDRKIVAETKNYRGINVAAYWNQNSSRYRL